MAARFAKEHETETATVNAKVNTHVRGCTHSS